VRTVGPLVIDAVGVVVPARDEEALLPGCLASVRAAADQLPPGVEVVIVVAADRCTDATTRIASETAVDDGRLRVVVGSWGCAGGARWAATDLVRRLLVHHDPRRTWLASTDADSVVSRGWLTGQLLMAADGWDAVAGTVAIPTAAAPLRARFEARYPVDPDRPHPYVHGANLGVRASAYTAVGGWGSDVATGEDQRLWDALHATGHRMCASPDLHVVTSPRLHGRAPDGFAARLRELTA
jgi:glycosyltransferase involved in cell wall biosynthesis